MVELVTFVGVAGSNNMDLAVGVAETTRRRRIGGILSVLVSISAVGSGSASSSASQLIFGSHHHPSFEQDASHSS